MVRGWNDRRGLDFNLCPVFNKGAHLHKSHCWEVAADHVAVGGAHVFKCAEIFPLVGDEPRKAHQMFGSGFCFSQKRHDIAERLLGLRSKVVGLKLLICVPADLPCKDNKPAFG